MACGGIRARRYAHPCAFATLLHPCRAQKKPRMRLERDTLALAAFVSRPQAEAQIGANRDKSYTTNSVVSIQKFDGRTDLSFFYRLAARLT